MGRGGVQAWGVKGQTRGGLGWAWGRGYPSQLDLTAILGTCYRVYCCTLSHHITTVTDVVRTFPNSSTHTSALGLKLPFKTSWDSTHTTISAGLLLPPYAPAQSTPSHALTPPYPTQAQPDPCPPTPSLSPCPHPSSPAVHPKLVPPWAM